MPAEIVFSPEAENDLLQLYDFIAGQAGAERALGYTDRIVSYCESLALYPERGTRRDQIRPGLRTIGFERRATIAFHVTPGTVVIDQILYGGRDLATAFDSE